MCGHEGQRSHTSQIFSKQFVISCIKHLPFWAETHLTAGLTLPLEGPVGAVILSGLHAGISFFPLLYQLGRWNSEFLEMSKTPERAGRGFEALWCFWQRMVQSNFFLMLFYLLLSHYDGCWAGSEAQTSHNCTQRSGEDFYQIKFLVLSLCLLLL